MQDILEDLVVRYDLHIHKAIEEKQCCREIFLYSSSKRKMADRFLISLKHLIQA
jgi:hypothetical protein